LLSTYETCAGWKMGYKKAKSDIGYEESREMCSIHWIVWHGGSEVLHL
jgi:hypothetical protein